ncbi:hypothetical protein B0T11DRAFT_49020 [Plectosphaerella cucumerina]|uniref:Secreted protein n=1 Tax=Plectosphaerella cucumerina TaxID=40658 RepID=A0A8K0TLV6_9PEZI|nr:hypothetical protein B0T11DRAFT_49020 [Plectosphaerella cucumerina]
MWMFFMIFHSSTISAIRECQDRGPKCDMIRANAKRELQLPKFYPHPPAQSRQMCGPIDDVRIFLAVAAVASRI